MTLEREELRDDWTVTMVGGTGAPDGVAGRTIPATVPGQVHTDLEREGRLADPTFDRNEDAGKWVGRADWSYRRTVDVDPKGFERVDLVCDGLDTVAELSLDGVVVGTTRNMHRRYRFDARDQTGGVGRGSKTLEVLFESPYREAGRVAAKAGSMPGPYDEPFPYIRKMASNLGWDWGLTAGTSGPWRPIAPGRWSTAPPRGVGRALVRGSVDAVPGALALRTSFEYAEDTGPGMLRGRPVRTMCRISAHVRTPDLQALAEQVRTSVRTACAHDLDIQDIAVDIHIEDLHERAEQH